MTAVQSSQRPLPSPTSDSMPFWQGASEGLLRIQRCLACGTHRFPPGNRCPQCWTNEYEWVTAKGEGTLFTFTVMRRAYHPGLIGAVPYVVGVVELAEGVRLITNIVDCEPDHVIVGMPVRVTFTELQPDMSIPTFAPARRTDAKEQ